MSRHINIAMILLSAALLQGCTAYRDTVRNAASALGAIGTRDLHQADYLERVFAQEPKIKNRYRVSPGTRVVTVKFLDDLPEGKSNLFHTRMIALKKHMRDHFKYEINTLIFIFPSQRFEV